MKNSNFNVKNKDGEEVGLYEGPRFQVSIQEPNHALQLVKVLSLRVSEI